ncbi:MAG TPA: anthranilate phosphoribosyltransferase [bacterium]|nr:anthranilate phosphoribosyltransferase [bacterium]
MKIEEAIKKLVSNQKINRIESAGAFREIMEGSASPILMSSFLTALRITGENREAIEGAVEVMREKCLRVKGMGIVVDTCGTGGDNSGTFNISTAAAIVGSACGLKVAKHGNRAVSSKSGSADVLEKLGMRIQLPPDKAERMLREINFAFLFAPFYHPAMKNIAPVRKELGFRTIFNLLGPLSNPAFSSVQIVGVGSPDLLDIIPDVLRSFGVRKAWIFYGEDGLDEISITGKTRVVEISDRKTVFTIEPEHFGLKRAPLKELQGGSPEENAEILRNIISGKESGAKRDTVLLNAAALLFLSGMCKNIQEGIGIAENAITSGVCDRHLKNIIEVSNAD